MYLLDTQHGSNLRPWLRKIEEGVTGRGPFLFPGFHLAPEVSDANILCYTQGGPRPDNGRGILCVCLGKGSQMPGSKNMPLGPRTQTGRRVAAQGMHA